ISQVDTSQPPESQWKQAWKSLRSNWIFWISATLLVIVLFVVIFPNVITSANPRVADLSNSLAKPQPGHIFGFDRQGYDVFARTIHGARASVIIGLLTTIIVTIVGLFTGAIAAFFGGWLDTIISRGADIFFAIPLLLAAIVGLSALNNVWPDRGYWGGVFAVVIALAAFGWLQFTRIARGAVMEIKNLEFVDAARSLGVSKWHIICGHSVLNALHTVSVTATVAVGDHTAVGST